MNKPVRNTHETAECLRRLADEVLVTMVIKPCKHCGSKQIMICGDGTGTNDNGWKLICSNCSIQTGSYVGETPEKAIESWNRTFNTR